MFTYLMSVRAILEIIEAMDTPSLINALRRFLAVRGSVSRFYSDRGTNFVAAQLKLIAAFGQTEKNRIKSYIEQQECEWVFNPPHASYMGEYGVNNRYTSQNSRRHTSRVTNQRANARSSHHSNRHRSIGHREQPTTRASTERFRTSHRFKPAMILT